MPNNLIKIVVEVPEELDTPEKVERWFNSLSNFRSENEKLKFRGVDCWIYRAKDYPLAQSVQQKSWRITQDE